MEKIIETPYGQVLFRPYRVSDEETVLIAWQAAFGKPMDPAIWRWKFHNNPFGQHMMMALNEMKEPIAMYNGVPVMGNWNGQTVILTQLMDHFSHPAYRRPFAGRKGIFVLLAEHFFACWGGKDKGTVFPYGFPGAKHFKLGKLFLQYARVSPMHQFTWTTHARKRWIWPSRSYWEPLLLGEGQFDRFWQQCQAHYPFSIIRSEQFLQWRFGEHPLYQYWVKGLKDRGGQLQAYVVGKSEGATAHIVDILSLPLSDSQWRWAWKKLSLLLYRQGILQLHLWLPENHFLTSPLRSLGVNSIPNPGGIVAGGRSFDTNLELPWITRNIFFTQADLDLT